MQTPFAIRWKTRPATGFTRPSFGVVRAAVGLLLITAALLKAHESVADSFGPVTTLEKFGGIAAVELELALGLWMLFGVFARVSRLVAIACFAGFAAVSFYKILHGDSSCGCFGRLSLRPWQTMIVDLAAVAALLVCKPGPPGERQATQSRIRLLGLLTVLFWPGLALAYLMDRPVADGQRVVLRPEDWRGKCLPLLPHIDIGSRLAGGRWTVMLYRRNCEACRAAIQRYRERSKASDGRPGATRIALVEIPPYSRGSDSETWPEGAFVLGRLDNSRNWSIRTPTEVTLQDCIVLTSPEAGGR
jgi:uncharacterized membrane protein YphA (DoxX/SURF4 family)